MNALALTDDIARHFGRARESYEQAARLQRLVAAKALSLLTPTAGLLLDLGSGPGWFHPKLKQHCSELIALDLSHDMLQKPGQHNKQYWSFRQMLSPCLSRVKA